ncbi:MAG: WbuC family cupin fold metalloprotein [Gammaproteobacteria bacterium]
MSTPDIETIKSDDQILAMVIRHSYSPTKTTFVTPHEFNQQVGFIVYPKGTTIPRHRHLPQERKIIGTSEVILVKSGRCQLEIFDNAGTSVRRVGLTAGDLVILSGGGHGFALEEDTVLVEVKQGPFVAGDDKVHF